MLAVAMLSEPIALGPWQLAGAAALVLLNAGLSLWLRLGLERRLLVASLRTVVQLLILGWILVPVFAFEHAAPVLGLGALMIGLAGFESVRRSSRAYRRANLAAFASLLLAGGSTTVLGTAVLVGVEPWWTAQYLVPLLGMILGNALTGISIGLDRVLAELDGGRDRVDGELALGATWWEAARPVAADSIRAGMIPILNSMSVVGLITIPGMMTGQILGGTDPATAARYQILIMFLIAGAVALGTGASVLMAARAMFDRDHRLRLDRLSRRPD